MQGTEIGSLYYDLNINDKNLTGQLNSADAQVQTLGSSFNNLGNKLNSLAATAAKGIAIFGGAAVAFGVKSVKAFEAYQDAVAGLNAGLANTGENVAVVTKKLQDQALALQKVTKFSNEQILSADAMLTTFKLSGTSISKLNPALLDMAEGLRDVNGQTIGLDEGAKLMGKAMGNAAGGVDGLVTALRRNGVIMTDAQKEIFKTGTEAERTATLVQIMNDNFGGRALAAGKTFSGQLTILKNNFNELEKAIGGAIVNAVLPYTQAISDYLNKNSAQIQKSVENAVKIFVEFTKELAAHWKIILEVIVAYKALKVAMEIAAVINALVGVVGALSRRLVINTVATEAATAATVEMAGASALLTAGVWGLAIGALAFGGFKLYEWWKHLKETTAATDEAVNTTGRYGGSVSLLTLATDKQTDAEKRLADAKTNLKTQTDLHKAATDALKAATDNSSTSTDELNQKQLAAFASSTDLQSAKDALRDANNKLSNATQQLKDLQYQLKDGFDATKISLGQFHETLTSGTPIAIFKDYMAQIQGSLEQVQAVSKINIQVNYSTKGSITLPSGSLGVTTYYPQRAEGGPVEAGMPYIVGEVGQELFVPKTSGTIIPNDKISHGKTASSTTINIGQINNQQDEEWVLRRLDRNTQLESMGISPQGN